MFRDSGSNTNTKICFEIRATALRPHLHTEGFPLRPHGPPTKGTSTEEFAITKLEYTTPLSITTISTQEAKHKAKTQSPLHKRDGHKAKITITSTQEARHKAKTTTTITSSQEG